MFVNSIESLAQRYFTRHLGLTSEGAFLRFCQCGDEEGKRLMSVLRLEVEMHLQRDCQPRLRTHQRESEAHTKDRVRQVNELKEGEGRKKYKMQGGPWWVMY